MRQRMWRSILALSFGAILAAAASANPPASGCGCETAKAKDGCNSCLKVWNAARIGQGCAMPAGCSSFAAERTFAFGSCKQFFNAGHDCKVCNAGPRERAMPCTYYTNLNR